MTTMCLSNVPAIGFRQALKLCCSTCDDGAALQVPGTPQQALYLTGRVTGPAGAQIMLELRMVPGQPGIDVSFKSEKEDLAQMAFATVQAVLSV